LFRDTALVLTHIERFWTIATGNFTLFKNFGNFGKLHQNEKELSTTTTPPHRNNMLITISTCGATHDSIMEMENTMSQLARRQNKQLSGVVTVHHNQQRKRKNTLIIPKLSDDGRFIKVVWTKLLKRQYMSNENPLELFDKLTNNRYFPTHRFNTVPPSAFHIVTSIPVRHLTGRNTTLNRPVGLKVYGLYTADQCSICENECRILSLVDSLKEKTSNIVRYYGSHYIGNSIWIETEPCFGTLGQLLSTLTKPVNESVITTIAKQLLQSLVAMHTEGIAHRDIRPSNIMICMENKSTYTLKLSNFHAGYHLQPTDNGTIRDVASLMFTDLEAIQWLAPEMLAREEEGDEESVVEYNLKCDIWSFGLTLWSIVNRASPFTLQTPPEQILEKIMSNDYRPSLRDFDHEYSLLFDDFLRKCLCREVENRWSSEELLKHEWLSKPEEPSLVNSLVKSTITL
jgi:serine/threonine protein kinase